MESSKNDTDDLISKAETVTDVENKFMVTQGGMVGQMGDWDWHIYYYVWNRQLMRAQGTDSAQCPVMTKMRGQSKKSGHMYT